jgi:hypothetical protein
LLSANGAPGFSFGHQAYFTCTTASFQGAIVSF